MTEGREILSRPYMTMEERARDRRALAAANRAAYAQEALGASAGLSEAGEQAGPRLNLWRLRDPSGAVVYVRCPSRSGAKIYASAEFRLKGPFVSDIVEPSEVPPDEQIHVAQFQTVYEYAEMIEAEKREKRR